MPNGPVGNEPGNKPGIGPGGCLTLILAIVAILAIMAAVTGHFDLTP